MSDRATPSTDKPYVAHEGDLATLKAHWATARRGLPQAVLLTAPVGGGKRAIAGELARSAVAEDDDTLLWRVALHDEEDGLQSLFRLYAGLYAGLHRSPMLRGKVEMALNAQLPHEGRRVQQWYRAFIEGAKKGAPKPGEQQFQVTLPRDNPLVGLVEIALGIARKFPILLELQNLHHVQSLAIHAFVEALVTEAREGEENARLLVLMGMEPLNDVTRSWYASPLLDFIDRQGDHLARLELRPWGAEEVEKYLASKGWQGDAANLARIAGGRPGFVAELADWLYEQGRLGEDLGRLELEDVADVTPDADELEPPGSAPKEDEEPKKGERKHAGPDDAERIAYLAALLGLSFPSGLVADLGGYDRDSVDDLLDATERIYRELQFSEPLGTWVYQFNRALLRESVMARHTADEDQELARRVGVFLERFLVPRGYAYLVKTMRLYADHGATQRASLLRSLALSQDQPQIWAMAHDLLGFFEDIAWPDPMRRTVYMNLVERMVQQGDVNQAEALTNEAMKWATEKQDRPLQAWLLFAGSRLDFRRQDLYRARDRANDALKLYTALEDKAKRGEVRAHLARIELYDGNPNAALEQARQAEELAPIPPIQASAEQVRGLVAKQRRKWNEAVEHFRKANEIAGNNGIAGLALEAGLNLGEVLLVSQQHARAADVLARVAEISRALQNPAAERSSVSMLAQAQAALRNFEAAIQHGQRALELTRQLKFDRLEAFDAYNLGFFNLMAGRPTEAVSLFRQARANADATDVNFQKELLFNLGTALVRIGEKSEAAETLRAALAAARQAKDWPKLAAANEQLADLAREQGHADDARKLLEEALQAAEQAGLKDVRKGIRRKLAALKA